MSSWTHTSLQSPVFKYDGAELLLEMHCEDTSSTVRHCVESRGRGEGRASLAALNSGAGHGLG